MKLSLHVGSRVPLAWMIIVLSAGLAWAKHTDDVVVMKNGDRMTGEIKKLQQGELTFKADYMENAVSLDWSKVARLESKDSYLISMTDGHLFSEHFRLDDSGGDNVQIGPGGALKVSQMNVLRILPIESNFWRQLEGSIDLGFSFNNGSDQYQADLSSSVTYRRGEHSLTGRVDSNFSGQTKGTRTARNEFSLDYRKQFSPKWYLGGLFDLLRSDEQSLDLRVTGGGLLGRNLVQTERTRLSTFVGMAANREKYKVFPARQWTTNADATGGLDFRTFRFASTEINSRFIVFPSLTPPGRVRAQLKSDLNIKLAKDFWWGFHIYENFDSKPPIKADKNDLSVTASIGWKF